MDVSALAADCPCRIMMIFPGALIVSQHRASVAERWRQGLAQERGPGVRGPGTKQETTSNFRQDRNMLVPSRRRLRIEVWIVLGLSLGQSAVYSVVQLLDKMTRAPLAQGTSTLNRSQSTREYFDLTYQLLDIIFALVPVLLVIYFMTDQRQTKAGTGYESGSAFHRLGFDFARPGRDLLQGLGLAALIGIPSLGLYAAGRALGITTAIIPSALDAYWWTIPVLILSAMRHAIVEEVIVVG